MMRRRGPTAVAAVLIGFVVALGFAWSALADPSADKPAAAQLFAMVNQERLAAGLAPLVFSDAATQVSEGWSVHMAMTNELAHNDAWFSPETRSRAGAKAVGENVAYNADLADAHRRLMASPGHRANILDPRFQQIGIGAVRGPNGSWWITQDFLQSRAASDTSEAVAKAVPAAPTTPTPPTTTPPPPPASVPTTAPPAAETARDPATDGPTSTTTSALVTPTTVAVEAPAVHASGGAAQETASGPVLRPVERPGPASTASIGFGGFAALLLVAVAIGTVRMRGSAKTPSP
jgi:hypothetical protein